MTVESSAAYASANNVLVEKGSAVGTRAREGHQKPVRVGLGTESRRGRSHVAVVGWTRGVSLDSWRGAEGSEDGSARGS